MDALFFSTRREDALCAASSHDWSDEPIADALRLEDPSCILELARILGVEARPRALRDATCRSFPVWELGAELTRRIARLDDDEIDEAAGHWHESSAPGLDADPYADPYELGECLVGLRAAARAGDAGEALFVLFEERAW